MIQKAFRDDVMNAVQIQTWHKCFKDGQEFIESDPWAVRPATSRTPENVDHIQATINQDQWLTVQELQADLGTPKSIVSKILTQDVGMKYVIPKYVPWFLLREQKEHHAAVANDAGRTI